MDYKDYYAETVSAKKADTIRDCRGVELIRAILSCDSSIQADILNRVNTERYKKAAAKAALGIKPKKHYSKQEDKARAQREKTKMVLLSILGKNRSMRFYNAISRKYAVGRGITLDYLKKNVSYSDVLNTRGVGKETADLVKPLLKDDQ